MHIWYRISEGSYNKPKFPNATKEHCLENFLEEFSDDKTNVINIYRDRITSNLNNRIEDIVAHYNQTRYSNIQVYDIPVNKGGSSAQSFSYVIHEALKLSDDEVCYFIEDDYLHLPNSNVVLNEGIKLNPNGMISLYDCVDKYRSEHSPYVNPLVGQEGGEETTVFLTKSKHWKKTNSTTCSFVLRVRTLREDYEIWKKHCFTNVEQKHPNDFACFCELVFEKGRVLLTPIPGLSTHCEELWKSPLIDWSKV